MTALFSLWDFVRQSSEQRLPSSSVLAPLPLLSPPRSPSPPAAFAFASLSVYTHSDLSHFPSLHCLVFSCAPTGQVSSHGQVHPLLCPPWSRFDPLPRHSIERLVPAVSTLFDSLLWGYWVWPELHGFLFNVIRGHSSEWGVSPFYFYFVSALPRALLGNILLVPGPLLWSFLAIRSLGVRTFFATHTLEASVRPFVVPAVAFVFLYSFLAHKELRFIIYVVPILNIAAAITLKNLCVPQPRMAFPLRSFGLQVSEEGH